MKDTLRILVSWKCNLKCTYCCNEQEQFRKDIIPTAIEDIKWGEYNTFCVTGGEPLLNLSIVSRGLDRIPPGKMVVLYTNGILLNKTIAQYLRCSGVKAINVGLYNKDSFQNLINNVLRDTAGLGLSVRFHAQDIYKEDLEKRFSGVSFRFWTMNDCDRENEDRIILSEKS